MFAFGLPALALGWFAIWGWLFWFLFVVEFLALALAVRSEKVGLATITLAGFVAICLMFGDVTFSLSGVWSWVVAHRWWVGACAAIYFGGFFAWPFYAWGLLVRDQLRQRHAIRILFLQSIDVPEQKLPDEDDPMPEEYRAQWTKYVRGDPGASSDEWVKPVHTFGHGPNYNALRAPNSLSAQVGDEYAAKVSAPPRIRDHWSKLGSWSTYWPAHVIGYLIGDFLVDMFNKVWKKLRGVFDALAVRWYAKANQDFVDLEEKPEPAEMAEL